MVETTILAEKNDVVLQIIVNAGRPLQWAINLLHLIELPYHHLFQHVDGATEEHNSFLGQLQKLMECEVLLEVAFDLNQSIVQPFMRIEIFKIQIRNIFLTIKTGDCLIVSS